MRYLLTCLSLLSIALLAEPAAARNVRYILKIQDVLQSTEYQEQVGQSVTFSFGDKKIPVASTSDEIVADARQHFKGRSDEATCRSTMIQALVELSQRAQRNGNDAVINVVSYFRRQTFSSTTEFECHGGSTGSFVSLKGTMARKK